MRKKSWEHDEASTNGTSSAARRKVVADLTRRDVIDVLDDIADRVTPIQANRSHSLISAV